MKKYVLNKLFFDFNIFYQKFSVLCKVLYMTLLYPYFFLTFQMPNLKIFKIKIKIHDITPLVSDNKFKKSGFSDNSVNDRNWQLAFVWVGYHFRWPLEVDNKIFWLNLWSRISNEKETIVWCNIIIRIFIEIKNFNNKKEGCNYF